MAEIEDKGNPSVANLSGCDGVLLDGFDGDQRAVLVIQTKKPVTINGQKRNFVGTVLELEHIKALATQLMTISKRQSRKISLSVPGQLVKPVRIV